MGAHQRASQGEGEQPLFRGQAHRERAFFRGAGLSRYRHMTKLALKPRQQFKEGSVLAKFVF